jgi:acetyl esterase
MPREGTLSVVPKLDPQVAAVLARLPTIERDKMTPDEARRATRERAALVRQDREPVAVVRDWGASQFTPRPSARIYAPDIPEGAAVPAVVYFHGGGWVLGDLDGPDSLCRRLVNGAGCVVISIDYPLAPEHKFPAAVEAGYASVCAVERNALSLGIDPKRIAVGGESAGGNLAAAAALLARARRGPPIALQILLVPVTNYSFDTSSYLENAEGFGLTRAEMMWFWRQYLREPADGNSPYASPLRASDLRGLPRALIVTAEFDPLRDEGICYALRLLQAGVPVELHQWPGTFHGSHAILSAEISQRQIAELFAALRRALAE